MNFLKLTKDKLDIGAINDLVADKSCGAISIFAGTTRDNFEEKKVVCLEYEAYETMAIKIMTNICDDIRSKWPDIKNIAIYHRLDIVPVKESSVIIAISSPHRHSSLQSVQFAIDELKRTVPIWKKEQYENNSFEWKANKECGFSRLKKRQKINFNDVKVIIEPVSSHLIQITADDNEIQRRINKFIEKKREEIDLNNILDYTTKNFDENNESSSCARLNSVLVKREDSKGHLRVYRVKNEIGPHDPTNYLEALDKLMENLPNGNNQHNLPPSLPIGISERVKDIEKFLNINLPTPKSIYDRLKTMEDKISYLESISPEYKHFVDSKNEKPEIKKTFTIDDLNNYIEILKKKIEIKTETEN